MEINIELLQKYNVPVPRYTSYPPANHFSDNFGEGNYHRLLEESNQGTPSHIAIYIHIPFCKKLCYYCGCNSCAIGEGKDVQPYMQALKKEIDLVMKHVDRYRLVSQIHYGGGTPNSIDVAYIKELNQFLFDRFHFIDDPEIAIECHPGYLDEQYINDLLEAGFNRFSLGVQDFDRQVLKLINREPSLIPIPILLKYLRNSKNRPAVNLDFIYGLPGQNVNSFTETIDKAIALQPDRLVTFSYAHVPWLKKNQLILEKRGIPGPDDKMNMFIAAYNRLTGAGYYPIGFDHYVLPKDELYTALKNRQLHRNFQGYCTRRTTGQVYAFGTSAISQLEKGYSQNTKDIDTYIHQIEKGKLPVEKGVEVNSDQMITREIINELMCNKKLVWSELSDRLRIPETELKNKINLKPEGLNEFARDKLLTYSDDGLTVSREGSLFIRNIAAYLDKGFQQKEKTYSKSV